jgi:anthranilate phosphoribosyltransferase
MPDTIPARPDPALVPEEHPFAQYVRTLGRGPGRSRALTREEARTALTMVLQNEARPEQVGAFLMLLRYRGEDPAEMAGLVEAARAHFGAGLPPGCAPVALDWPSYGAGRTRGAPWFLLAALALARAGHRVLMHGSNEFTRGTPVTDALAALGLPVCADPAQAAQQLDAAGFAYLPLAALCPGLDALLRLRGVLGLRSPINTAARLLNPFDAPAGVDGVFHPPYIALHVNTAALLQRGRLVVVKGGGGEAERNPAKPMTATWYDQGAGQGEIAFPPLPLGEGTDDLIETWSSGQGPGAVTARATIALGLLAMGQATSAAEADAIAVEIWAARL